MNMHLTERESKILAATVEDYIHTAQPVPSKRVRDVYRIAISPATIRNTMADLERNGYLTHPHTSAGKVPTDQGYRTYVNQLMVVEDLDDQLAAEIIRNLEEISGSIDKRLQIVAHIISQLSGNVGITIAPVNLTARLSGIRLVPISMQRTLYVLELDSGSLHTVVAETQQALRDDQLITVEEILRERLCGLTLEEIQATIGSRLSGTLADELGVTTFILEHSNELFDAPDRVEMYTQGLSKILESPEFVDPANVTILAGLVENEGRLRALIQGSHLDEEVQVTIGTEHDDEQLETFATISRGFYQGGNLGVMAVLAPTRVNYAQVFAILEFLSNTLSEMTGDGS